MADAILFRSYILYFIMLFLNVGPFHITISISADCVWYGQCGSADNITTNKILNCLYKGPAKPAATSTIDVLKRWCPNYFEEGDKYKKTCCDQTQSDTLNNNLLMASGLLSRCPSCQINFVEPFCELTCSPYQNSFVEVINTVNTTIGKIGISEINMYLSKTFAQGMYDSCKDMKMPSTNGFVMELLCDRPVRTCSPEILYSLLGDVNRYSHFQINFFLDNNIQGDYKPLEIKSFGCNETPKADLTPCTCQDCKDSCPSAHPIAPSSRIYVGEILLSQFLTILIFLLLISAVIPLLIYYHRWEAAYARAPQNQKKLDCLSILFAKIRHKLRKLEKVGALMEKQMEKGYGFLGRVCALYPWTFLALGGSFFIICSIGICFIKITTNPIELWASETSRTRLDREYFDKSFGPFYRTEQVIIKAENLPNVFFNESEKIIEFGPVFNKNFLLMVYELQQSIQKISVKEITLKDLCFTPLSASNTAEKVSDCLILSVWGFFQDNPYLVLNGEYLFQTLQCLSNPIQPNCLATWGGPIFPDTALGGFLEAGLDENGLPMPERANVLIVTYLLKNYLEDEKQKPAKEWENMFIELLKKWKEQKKNMNMKVSFTSESSVENELKRNSGADILIISISYLTMFIYIVLFLGRYSKCNTCLIDSKFSLGLFGLLLVLMSVSSSVGFFGYVGVPVTPIIIEVIPFLTLAIGVDNIFIMVQTYDRLNELPGETVIDRTSRMLGLAGPSITLTSLSECCSFFIGALSNMPAVQAFALYAGMALLMDFFLQITCFVSLVSLDSKRAQANRYDIVCCFKSDKERIKGRSFIQEFFSRFVCPVVMHRFVRPVIIIFFIFLSFMAMYTFPLIKVGLSPELSMPKDSYTYEYLKDLNKYLSIGPPLYFVVKDSNLEYANPKIQNLFCGSPNCDSDSLILQVFSASKTNSTYVAKPASSWIDDYFDWTAIYGCCKVYSNNTFCQHSDYSCSTCEMETNHTPGRPSFNDFERYISFFLQDNPDDSCIKSGHPSYGSGVVLKPKGKDEKGFLRHEIGANYYRSYHTILKTSEDFYLAVASAYQISENITKTINAKISRMGIKTTVRVFPYSVFYVFYEQYLTLWQDGVKGILISFAVIFLTTFLLLGLDIWSACLVVLTIAMIIMNLAGVMYFWNIELNAISLVNIILAIGISVEFCSHLTHFFIMTIGPDRVYRASVSLSEMGSSVFAGITITKLIGITVLAFASSQIFQVYYFRMFFSMVLIGAFHGLIFHPVLLSYLGSETHLYFLQEAKSKENPETSESDKKVG